MRFESVPIADRLSAKFAEDESTGCWVWNASTRGGYGQIRAGDSVRGAHRVMYELARGPVADDLDLDHLCRNTLCVNPDHLEPVSRRENLLRGVGVTAENARKTECTVCGRQYRVTRSGNRHCRHSRASDIRSWARSQGYSIGVRGVISLEIRAAFEAAAA